VADDVYWFHDSNAPATANPRVTTYEVAAGVGTAPKGADAEVEETSVETYENTASDASPSGMKSKDTKRSPTDARALSWLAWSRQTVAMCNERPYEGALELDDLGENEAFAATALELTKAIPWRVSFDDITLHVLQSDLDVREALMALNGAVVGLLKTSAPGRRYAECVGVAVVRGIDVDNRYIYILTPVSSERLKLVTTLALGTLEFPPRLLGPSGEYPYMQVGAIANEGSGSKAIKSRNNILRQNTAPSRP
jgi:polynucleotide 5'-hydroxyl-kinase GRC3/NOL9